ncbi:uncharacterized protein MONBRDRAFT_11784 [Monosiga brevicollis MX1]|uniref:Uncharacterized protein n=1 Tax=Monosiga brevicollis TaxID=81824 RepID=A9VAA0_MONBE|nr:uncharacterized protein MONBRDRAFT_11784 [Monosiga brevicollis MX1]EDQ85450.1 predicted protein [Monosiga brevicollis MX1]|eukprot:XP_001749641.1 hypothetical protein [Monosiga brevicollis MX1]
MAPIQSLSARTYLVLAGAFFAACAWAQINDPDSLPWMAAYLGLGTLLNAVVVTGWTSGLLASVLPMVVGGILAFAGHLLYTIRTDLDVTPQGPSASWQDNAAALVWQILEHEQGREVGGLLLLAAHVGFLRALAGAQAGRTTGWANKLAALVMVLALGGAAYAWRFQPEMNARYHTEHCSGAFSMGRHSDN